METLENSVNQAMTPREETTQLNSIMGLIPPPYFALGKCKSLDEILDVSQQLVPFEEHLPDKCPTWFSDLINALRVRPEEIQAASREIVAVFERAYKNGELYFRGYKNVVLKSLGLPPGPTNFRDILNKIPQVDRKKKVSFPEPGQARVQYVFPEGTEHLRVTYGKAEICIQPEWFDIYARLAIIGQALENAERYRDILSSAMQASNP